MKDLSKKTKITIISILSVTVLLVAGITYAYFSAPTVSGNSGANTIAFVTGTHGNIQISYYNGDGTISMDNIDLKESEQGTTRRDMVKFSVTYPGNQEEKVTIMWKEVFNDFCQYQSNNACTNNPSNTYVGDEIYFKLYECDSEGDLTRATTTTQTNCDEITRTDNNAVPITSEDKRLQNNESISLTNTTKYYVMILNIDNLTTPQDYNQGRTFRGRIAIEKAQTYIATFGADELSYSSTSALGYKLLTDNQVLKTTTAATLNKGAAPATGTNIVSENGIYRSTDDDGHTYYYRGGEGCSVLGEQLTSYTTAATCKANSGKWLHAYPYDGTNSYKCYMNGTPEVCEAAGGTWYYLNNNVKYAGFNWKVVRINGDGSIRVVLDGITIAVKKEGSDVFAGSNTAYNHASYYDTDGSSGASTRIGVSLEEQAKAKAYASYTGLDTPAGEDGGGLETAINEFYTTYIDNGTDIDYTSYLADSAFYSDTTWGETSGSQWYFLSEIRVFRRQPLSYLCPEEGTYKVGGTTGIRLSYPIATLSAAEVVYAGGWDNTYNLGYYLNNPLTIKNNVNTWWWTMTPGMWYLYGIVEVFSVSFNGRVNSAYVDSGYSVRPVLNLKSDVLISGGYGTEDEPYIIGN